MYNSIETLPKNITILLKEVQKFAKHRINPWPFAKIQKKLSKWRNFAKSGHNDRDIGNYFVHTIADHCRIVLKY